MANSSPSLLGEGDRPRSGWWRGRCAIPLRQSLRDCHLPETSSGRNCRPYLYWRTPVASSSLNTGIGSTAFITTSGILRLVDFW